MTQANKSTNEEQVACEVCLKEIPASAATCDEVEEYVRYFCGLECYATWKGKGEKSEA